MLARAIFAPGEKTDLDTITGAAVNQYFENRSALARARR